MRPTDEGRLRIFLPRLPSLDASLSTEVWIDRLLQINCGETLTSTVEGSSERRILDSCSISREGLSYRLQIKKNCCFADGSEIAAEDVMDSLQRVARQNFSTSGLNRILRFSGPQLQQSFRLQSRYRLEILLNRNVPDFLERLSHPECFLHKRDKIHLTSGPWQLLSSSDKELLLQANSHHESVNAARYQHIVIQTLDAATWDREEFIEAFVALFPGDRRQTPATNILNDRTTITCKPQIARLLWVPPGLPNSPSMASLALAMTDYARQRSIWRKKPLRSFFENQAFQQDLPLISTDASPPTRPLKITCLGAEPVAPFWDDLRAFLQSRWGWELSLNHQGKPDAYLLSLYEGSAEESETTLGAAWASLDELYKNVSDPAANLAKKMHQEDEDFPRQKLTRSYLQQFSHNPALIPFYRTPILLHSNRVVHRSADQSALLLFHQIGGSLRSEQTEELRRTSLSALGTGVQMLVHDVKRPFSMLQGLLTLLESNDDPERLRELAKSWLPEVRRVTQTVQEMISDILEMAADQELSPEPLSLADVLNDALNLLLPANKQLSLHFQPRHRLMLEGDRFKLARVLANLLNNAVHATPDGGTLQVLSSEESQGSRRQLSITVHNSGSYIAPEQREKIFQAFFTEGKRQGTGLGLAIVQKIILSHGGQILCESDPSSGTRFIFTVPASYREDSKSGGERQDLSAIFLKFSPLPALVPQASIRVRPLILLVDDDSLYTAYMQEVLSTLALAKAGLQIYVAENSKSAEALAAQRDFDLILVDYELGSDDGIALIERLRTRQAKALIGLHSHHSGIELHDAALRAGADIFEPKPLTPVIAEQLLIRLTQHNELPRKFRLILVEDDPLYQDMWRDLRRDILTFDNPEQLLAALTTDPDLLSECQALVTDHYFMSSAILGSSLAQTLRQQQPNLAIYLSSQVLNPERLDGAFTGSVAKDPDSIRNFLSNLGL